jgi:hypothetical protein
MRAVIVAFFLAGVAVAGDGADFPRGTYSTKVGEDKVSIRFEEKGKYVVLFKGESVVEGMYKVKKDTISFQAEKGKFADKDAAKQVGTYRWKLDGKNLTFKKVEDENGGRAKALTSGTWTKE